MGFRNVIIESIAHISLRSRQLVIRTDTEHSVPVEDLSALLLENRQSTITTAALSHLGQCGCTVFLCDEKHMPCAVLLPFSQHSRALSVLRQQLDIGEVLKKQLWQQLIVSKIQNQAACLRLCGQPTAAEGLLAIAAQVRSGDSTNQEAFAAHRYFPALFGSGFTRSEDCGYNAALNYGYAILRGHIARTLAVYGFTPALGLHHRSELNSFNLADDLIEPFRPLVDLAVRTLADADTELTPNIKRMLFNVLNLDILSGGQHHSAAYAVERTVQSLHRSLKEGKPLLLLPQLLGLEMHAYE